MDNQGLRLNGREHIRIGLELHTLFLITLPKVRVVCVIKQV